MERKGRNWVAVAGVFGCLFVGAGLEHARLSLASPEAEEAQPERAAAKLAAAQPVKHEYQKDIEFSLFGMFLYELYFIAVSGADFEPGNSVFLFLTNDGPTHTLRKFTACFPLHRDICLILLIVVYLLGSGNPV